MYVPFLRFKGFDKPIIEQISPSMIDEFAELASIPKEIVKIELLQIEQITNSPLSVEIYMFQREQAKHDAIASMIHKKFSELGLSHIHIFFVILSPSLYYKEGKPLHEHPNQHYQMNF